MVFQGKNDNNNKRTYFLRILRELSYILQNNVNEMLRDTLICQNILINVPSRLQSVVEDIYKVADWISKFQGILNLKKVLTLTFTHIPVTKHYLRT